MMSESPINANEKLPWGWHFFPSPVELINLLEKKVKNQKEQTVCESQDISDVLREIDLSQVEPWEIKGFTETCSIRATHADEQHQFFYTQKEQKYRHGKRSNRATKGGFWKATGRDKPIYGTKSPTDTHKKVIGFRKALVFYGGRAPNGTKTDWILHEYRLESCSDNAIKDEQWVACHMFMKERNSQRREPEAVEIAPVDAKEQLNECVDPHHQQGANVKPEPGYHHQSFSFVAPTSHPPCGGDDWSLPGLREESTYPAHRPTPTDVAVQFPRATTGRMMTSMPSFDQVPMPARQFSFDERPITDILFDIYNDQMQPSGAALDGLW